MLLFVVALCAASLYPTINWYFLVPAEVKQRVSGSRESIRDFALSRAREDLAVIEKTLSGDGSVEMASFVKDNAAMRAPLMHLLDAAKKRAKDTGASLPKNASVQQVFGVFKDRLDVFNTVVEFYRTSDIKLKEQKNKIINLGLDLSGGISVTLQVDKDDLRKRLNKEPSDADMRDAISRAIVVLQSRIDRFGVSEPKIRRQNSDSILIEIPGDNDRERVNSFIQGRGSLSFRIVNEAVTRELISLQTLNPAWTYDPAQPPDFLPAGTEIMEYVTRDEFGLDKFERWIAVYQDVDTYGVDGAYLRQAQVIADNLTGQPLVDFQLNSEGAQKLSKLTSDYLNQSMAIVLDDKVRAYATLTTVISTGQAVIQGFSREMAQDIAIILQTAALPVNLSVVNQQVIGPTLGQTVIDAGLRASVVGLALIVLFMTLYYLAPGFIAIISLLFNLLLLAAILAAFNFTITLTGIAGIILTMGMAVDSNVLIYERMKEELWAGKPRKSAIQNAFKKAFLTIVDANVTTFIAAIFISQIASGPVQGFAVTLSAGIITTLTASLFVSRLMFDIATDTFRLRSIRLTWRKLR